MGIDIDGKMMVGAWVEDVAEKLELETGDELWKFVEDNELSTASPYYDSEPMEWFIGLTIPDTPISEAGKLIGYINEAQNKLAPLLGEDLIIAGLPNVW